MSPAGDGGAGAPRSEAPDTETADAAGCDVVVADTCADRADRGPDAGAHGAAAVLIRPDGHAAWVRAADGTATGPLAAALARWCPRLPGPATAR